MLGLTCRGEKYATRASASPACGELAQSRGRLKVQTDVLQASLEGDLSARHRLVLEAVHKHLAFLEEQIAALDRALIEAMKPYEWACKLLRTIYVVLVHHQPYRDTGIDYEAMSVARSAPR